MTKQFLKVEQFHNKNQFIIKDNQKGVIYFQSYDSLVATWDRKKGRLTLGKCWDYSNTTRKHLYLFINDYVYNHVINNGLYVAKNKRQAIEKMIKAKIIRFNKNMD